MCGIYATNIFYNKKEVIEKLKLMEFRGPDNLGYLKIRDVTLGHVRLSIIDLDERSNQPFSFESFTISYNGEIYNYEEIKKELEKNGYFFNTTSDTEVIIKGYKAYGRSIVQKLNGMFSFTIFDSEKNHLFCARDRIGVKPFYYYWKDKKFEICSQLSPIINKHHQISTQAISIYLDCGYIPSPYSILENVYKLPPGNFMEINLNNGIRTISEYWNLRQVKQKKISYEKAKKELHLLLKDSVKIRLKSDVPIGSFLSGGIDSALVSSIASKHFAVPLKTFTIGFDNPQYDESKIAEKFANVLNTKHETTICKITDVLESLEDIVKVYDEPFADSSALPSLLLNKIAKEHVTVALSGDGGDESFFGYYIFDVLNLFNKVRIIPLSIRKLFSKLPFHKIFKSKPGTIHEILTSKDSAELAEKINTGFDSLQLNKETLWLDHYKEFKNWSSISFQQLADLNIKLWLENDSNVKVDRASMASSLEVRSPFLDYRIIEYARTLPTKYKYVKGKKKRILRDILDEYIPEKVFDLPKKGFSIPLKDWIRNELKVDIIAELNDDFLNLVPNFNKAKFKDQLKDHLEGQFDYSFNIWKLYVLAKWFKRYKGIIGSKI